MTLTVTDRRRDAVTVTIGAHSATILRSEIVEGLRHVTHPGTCVEHALIRGLAFNRGELERLIVEMGGAK